MDCADINMRKIDLQIVVQCNKAKPKLYVYLIINVLVHSDMCVLIV